MRVLCVPWGASRVSDNIIGRLQGLWEEAARKMAEVVDDDTFRSLEGKSKHQLWLELCDLITKHPREVASLRVDAILRSGIRKFTDEVPSFSAHAVLLPFCTSLAACAVRAGGPAVDVAGGLLHPAGHV